MKETRNEWVRALTAHPPEMITSLAQRIVKDDWKLIHLELPQTGLGMLKLADGAFNEPYYLGEFPLARCHVRLILPDEQTAEGGAHIMTDDTELAESLAILDGVLAERLPGWEEVAALVKSGIDRRVEEHLERCALLSATRVDFSLLGTAEEEDED